MKNKVISILLSLCMIIGVVHYNSNSTTAFDNGPTFKITYENQEVNTIVIPQDSKKTLTVEPNNDAYCYQWQIVDDVQSNTWIDIYGQTNASIDVSYTMVSLMLDASHSTYLRCIITKDEQKLTTDPISVTIAPVPPFTSSTIEKPLVQSPTKGLKVARAGEFVTITVNYLDSVTKNPLYNPYIVEINSGDSFNQTVLSPTFLGFAPYYFANDYSNENPNLATDNASSIILNYDSLDNNVVINVFYKPIQVSYAVRYFFQDIFDDLYTENESLYRKSSAETGKIIETSDLALTVEQEKGFTRLYHYPESVAADGSTVFECYYDRNYYLMKFDCSGGYGVEPIYARYQTPIVIGTPIRNGYTFLGWDELIDTDGDGKGDLGDGTIETEMPAAIPNSNKTYQAIWEPKETKVTFIYWKENANDDGYSYWGSSTTTYASSIQEIILKTESDKNSPVSTEELRYFSYDEMKNPITVNLNNEGIKFVDIFYKRNEYTLRFYVARKDINSNYYIRTDKNNIDSYLNSFASGKENNKPYSELKNLLEAPDIKTESNGGDTFYYFEFTAKYEEFIMDKWPVGGAVGANNITSHYFDSWFAEGNASYVGSGNKKYIQGPIAILSENLITDPSKQIASNYTMYFAKVNGNIPTLQEVYYRFPDLNNPPNYSELFYSFIVDSPGNLNPIQFEGFNPPGNGKGNPIYFIYTRKAFDIFIKNKYDPENDKTITGITYESSLKNYTDYNYLKDNGLIRYPSNLEKDAYEFDGLYTSDDFLPGTKLNEYFKMPAENLSLYANWVPIKHSVRFFKTYDDLLQYEISPNENQLFNSQRISHNFYVESIEEPMHPTKPDDYHFVGWFYMKNGVKTAYIPSDIPILRDMNIFAEWSSQKAVPYKIEYVMKDSGNKIAEDTNGYAFEGTTRTFLPKVGNPYNQLYPDLNDDPLFPLVESHSITMKEVPTDLNNPNTYQFKYVEASDIVYYVRYVDQDSGVLLEEPATKRMTSSAVVTERFKVFPNYVPDAFYKRLIISVQENGQGGYEGTPENVITFYYKKNDTSGHYAIHHMKQKVGDAYKAGTNYALDGSGDYLENVTLTEGVADKVNGYLYKPVDINGYTLVTNYVVQIMTNSSTTKKVESDGNIKIEIDDNGTDLYVFYKLNDYPYTVKYLNYNDPTIELHPTKEENYAQYGSIVSEVAPKIEGYSCSSSLVQTLKISSYDDETKENPNVIIFYYIPNEYHVNYKVINNEGGSVSLTLETILVNGTLAGSTPKSYPNYSFIGWYKDAEGKIPVSIKEGTIDADGKFIPNIHSLKAYPEENIFYAKFMEPSGALTITRTDAIDEGNGDQVFVYEITKDDDENFTMKISLKGNSSKTIIGLPQGNYTITQRNSWSWRYDDHVQPVSLNPPNDSIVIFSDKGKNNQWLSGNSQLIENRGNTHEKE